MKITKIKIKNLLGIKEVNLDGTNVEVTGTNGAGKSSILDAIRYALTNKSSRECIVRKGETEGEILIETDAGLSIDRKARNTMADYKSVKQNGREVGSPETYLKDIFTPLQLNPVEFMEMGTKEQNAIILDMIEYPWDMNLIKEWFGEIPSWVNFEQNILAILNDIQSERGQYYIDRQNVNRDIRNKKAMVDEIGATLPCGYEADKWREASVGDLYREVEKRNLHNANIDKAKQVIENKNNKIRKFEADLEIEKAALDREYATRNEQISKTVTELKAQIEKLLAEQEHLDSDKSNKLALAEQTYKANVAEFEAQCKEYAAYETAEYEDIAELNLAISDMERMKSFINEYDRMAKMERDIEDMQKESEAYTKKIEKARELPGEILANCTIPIAGLSVENGIPLINGLPVSNLSEGEKLDLCIDVALQKPNGLQIILIDGVEKLSTKMRESLYEKCKAKGLQFIATRTTDDDELIITEL